ncbi:MAG TPA: hypothetical protein PLW93_03610 [Candidatus Absconditabacterales bacterium]|nr:hypothetical protein [Candidatus Absconditabacterales bacterium]HNG97333.1 hypothetical protein [Candidatus Absconditabacterales bacterium]
MKNNSLVDQLGALGFGETDTHIYLASIRMGACTINQLSSQTGINRVTTHDSVGRLIAKGIVLETFAGSKRLIYPQPIHHLQSLVEQEKIRIESMQQQVNQLISSLSALSMNAEYLPKIRISKGRQGIADTIKEIRQDKKDNLKIICDSWHFDELLTIHFMENIKGWKGSIQMIIPTGFEHFIFSAIAKNIPLDVQSYQDDLLWSGGMSIRGNKVALHAYEGIYITTTIIENKAISGMMEHVFNSFSRLTS